MKLINNQYQIVPRQNYDTSNLPINLLGGLEDPYLKEVLTDTLHISRPMNPHFSASTHKVQQ